MDDFDAYLCQIRLSKKRRTSQGQEMGKVESCKAGAPPPYYKKYSKISQREGGGRGVFRVAKQYKEKH